MNKKYIKGGTIVIPHAETIQDLDSIAINLAKELGFKPSRAETVAYLINKYKSYGKDQSPHQQEDR